MPDQVKHRVHRPNIADDDWQPVMVPRSNKKLVPISPDRVRRLREHLAEALLAMRARATSAPPLKPAPDGFTARVVQTACTLCRGWCCRNGADDAFLDDRTMARAAGDRPDLDAAGLLDLYIGRVPDAAFENSCIFHGKQGCTLTHALRSDVCNAYFCGGLLAFMTDRDPPTATRIFAGEGDTLRTSSVLSP
ncbi:MAG TPA: hypothetical protein VHX39_37535 [Acetobacteraceae bacterium]|jgi:hypothetical protein|nr:hypothetical protein [Acetobacteraceae bacterium]